MPLDESSIAGYVAVTGREQNVPDAYQLSPRLAVPHQPALRRVVGLPHEVDAGGADARPPENAVIGVVQLINKKRDRNAVLRPMALVEEQVIPFTTVDEELVQLARQPGRGRLRERRPAPAHARRCSTTFVHAAVDAIEQRDPTTSGHSERVAVLTVGLAERSTRSRFGPARRASASRRDQVEEIRYAALLHDFGKVAVQEKLPAQGARSCTRARLIAIRQRFAYILKAIEADYLRARLAALEAGGASPEPLAALDAGFQRRHAEAADVLKLVLQRQRADRRRGGAASAP